MKPNTPPPAFILYFLVKKTFAGVLVLVLVIAGALSYSSIVKEALPDLEIPMALVSTYWHGTSPSVIEKEVTNKIEQEIQGMKGLKRYTSGSMASFSILAVDFEADAPLRESMDLLRQKIHNAQSQFQKDIQKPSVVPIAIRDLPIATFVIFGNLDESILTQAAKKLKKRIQTINGIRQVEIYGGRSAYIRVQLLPERLKTLGISPHLVFSRLKEHEMDVPLGAFENREMPFHLKTQTAFHNLDDIRDLPLMRLPSGRALRLKEVAVVERNLYRQDMIATYSTHGAPFQQGIAISVTKRQGQDTVRLVEKLTEELKNAQVSHDWPVGMQYQLVSNNAQVISEELEKTFTNGWQAVVIVFAVLFLLLTWREALVAALMIPITILGTILVLYLMGYTFNVMTIIGLILALGLLVDDFILMMEGMHEYVFIHCLPFHEAAWQTIKSFAVPSLSGTVTTIMVFVPLGAIGGLDGKFIQIIPITAAICLVLSYLVSILIAVPLSQLLLKNQKLQDQTLWIDRVSQNVETRLREWLLAKGVASKKQSLRLLGIGLGMMFVSFIMATEIPLILYPKADGRDLGITLELPIDFKLEESHRVAQTVGEVLRRKPYLESILRITGEKDFVTEGENLSRSSAPHFIGFTARFTPKSERDRLGYQYVPELRQAIQTALEAVPGYRLTITPETGGSSNQDPIQIDLSGPDMLVLQELSEQVQWELSKLSGVEDVRDSLGQSRAETVLIPRREMLDFYGISEAEFNAQVALYLKDIKVSKLHTSTIADDLEVRLEPYWPSQKGKTGGPAVWEELQRIAIKTSEGVWVPISSLTDWQINQEPLTITHKNGTRNLTIMAKSYTLSYNQVYASLDPILDAMQIAWPPGYTYRFAGEKELADETYGRTQQVFLFSLLIVFCILVLQFNSFQQPLIILCAVLFGIMGVIWGAMILAFPFSFPVFIGIISLIGINVNDAIVMVATMNRHRAEGLPISQAAAFGASDRLRPIVSTTATTVLCLIPLAISDEGWRPLCLAIISGELVSTVTSLFFIPCLFNLLTPEQRKPVVATVFD